MIGRVQIKVLAPSRAVFLFGNLALFQPGGLLLPSVEDIEDKKYSSRNNPACQGLQTKSLVNLSDFQFVHICQREGRGHKTDVGINIWHNDSVGQNWHINV